jgi:hypothetical protein
MPYGVDTEQGVVVQYAKYSHCHYNYNWPSTELAQRENCKLLPLSLIPTGLTRNASADSNVSPPSPGPRSEMIWPAYTHVMLAAALRCARAINYGELVGDGRIVQHNGPLGRHSSAAFLVFVLLLLQ